MMKKLLISTILSLLLLPIALIAQENKVVYKFGGQIEFKSYFDDYRSKTSRFDLMYNYPLIPTYNQAGVDINKSNSLNFTVFASRLTFSVSGLKFLNADFNSYVETDFMGASETYLAMLRLRHAYMKLKWSESSLIIGQTNHLTSVDEVTAGTVAFASGYPFAILNRSMQMRYTFQLAKNVNMSVAAHMYSFHKSVGPTNAQSQAGLPDIHAQIKIGDANKVFAGLTVGYKFLKPRTLDADKNPISTTVSAYDISAFFKLTWERDVL